MIKKRQAIFLIASILIILAVLGTISYISKGGSRTKNSENEEMKGNEAVQKENKDESKNDVTMSADDPTEKPNSNLELKQKCVPEEGKKYLFIGQDLDTIRNYINADGIPVPSGTITYLNFYTLNQISGQVFGGLGIDNDYEFFDHDANWGSGPLNAYKNLKEFPDSMLSVGLSLVENASLGWTLEAIVNGEYDECLNKLSYLLEIANRPVFLRIGYEFDGIWNNYSPEKYKKAFQYIVEYIRNNKEYSKAKDNLVTVWQSCSSPSNEKSRGGHANINQWYPGDGLVDWIGLSYFVPQAKLNCKVMSQEELADDVLKYAREKGKPVMIAEATPQGYSLSDLTHKEIGWIDGDAGRLIREFEQSENGAVELWNQWFKSYFDFIDNNDDIIRAVSYINTNWDKQSMWGSPYTSGYWGDARVEINPTIKQLWIERISREEWCLQ